MDVTQIVIAGLALAGVIAGVIGSYFGARRQHNIDYLKLQYDTLAESVKNLAAENKELRDCINKSEADNDDLRKELLELNAKIARQEAEIIQLKFENEALLYRLSQLEEENFNLKNGNNDKKKRVL